MFDAIKKFIRDVSDNPEAESFLHDRKRLAEAALMYHVIAVDGIVEESEKSRLAEVLAEHFELEENEASDLLLQARSADQEAIDLYKFTSVLKRSLSVEERVTIIENLWKLVYADGKVHELEDNVIWRIAELLAVDSRDRMLLKQRISQQSTGEEKPA